MSAKRISVAEAAKIMGVSPQFIRIGLQRNLLPFGFATNMGGGCRYTYYINPKEFQEYLGLSKSWLKTASIRKEAIWVNSKTFARMSVSKAKRNLQSERQQNSKSVWINSLKKQTKYAEIATTLRYLQTRYLISEIIACT